MVTAALATDTAKAGRRGCGRSASRPPRCASLPEALEATPEVDRHGGGLPVGRQPDHGRRLRARVPAGAALDEHSTSSVVVVDGRRRSVSGTAWQVSTYPSSTSSSSSASLTRIVALPSVSLAMQVPQLPASQRERRRQAGASGALQQGLVRDAAAPSPSCRSRRIVTSPPARSDGTGSAVIGLSWRHRDSVYYENTILH